MGEKLYVLDAHALIYQVFHAIDAMAGPAGQPTNAVFGFVRDIEFLRKTKKPDYLLCVFDAPGPVFREQIDPNYKANRSAMPDDLRPQINMIHRVLEAYRIPVISQPGLEADDLIATIAHQASQRQIDAYICTSDKDARQCISPHVSIYDLRRNRIIDRQFVLDDWGIEPTQVVDYQAMVGDAVDNVKGVAGVGPKTATKLLQQFRTLEEIFEHIDEVPGKKLKENLYAGRQQALTSRELVRLKTDAPLPTDWSSWRLSTPDRERLLTLFTEFGFHRFADDVRAEMPIAETWVAHYVPITTLSTFETMLHELSAAPRLSVDLETTSIDPTQADIVGYALAAQPGKAYFVAVRAPAEQTELDPDVIRDRLRPLLENPAVAKVGQNLKYDIIALKRAGIELQGLAFDTMVASYLLEPGERNHNLDELSLRLLRHETIKIESLIGTGKQQRRMNEVDVPAITAYAGEDADVAIRLVDILEPKLRAAGLGPLFDDLECPLIEVLADLQHQGIKVDPTKLRELSAEFAQRLDVIQAEAYALIGHEFNLDSPTQLRKILFEELKLPIIKRTKTGPSTDQEVLEELALEHPLCAKIMEHRRFAKLKGTYLDALPALIHPETGRIHASFNQTVAATGRLSSSDPNLQNIPVRSGDGQQIRQAFLPGAAGQVLLAADYSQIELRMLAHFSGDAALRQAFADDQDIHAVVAAQIAGCPLDQVTDELRRRAKAVNFGIVYGLSPFGLAKQLKIDQTEAEAFIDAYFARYAGIDAFFTSVLTEAKTTQSVRTILGRRRPITGVKNTTGRVRNQPERLAINTVIQGSAADLIKKAMLTIHRRLKTSRLSAKMLLQIHDELVFEVDRSQVAELAELVRHEMTTAMTLDGTPLKVDLGVGPNWLDLDEIDA